MKPKKILFTFGCLLLIACCMVGLAACSDDDNDFIVETYDNPEWKKVEDLVATIEYDDATNEWQLCADSRYMNPFTGGIEEGSLVTITDWKDSYKEYSNGCLVNGEYGLVRYESDRRIPGIPIGTKYYEFKIKSIKKYEIPPRSRSLNEEESPMCLVLNHGKDSINSEMVPKQMASIIKERTISSTLSVRTFIHVIRSSNGTGLNIYQVLDGAMKNLNSFFEQACISFELAGYEYIDSDALNLTTLNNVNIVFSRNAHDNALDIYVLSDGSRLGSTIGISYDINSTACLVRKEHYKSLILPHEVGHCFGLYHTHHGTFAGEDGIPELVDGSNSEVAGDYVSDTPADPYKWGEESFGVDKNGDPYCPDPTNVMCYSPIIETHTTLTPGQLYRIHQQVRTGSIKACIKQTPLSIDGPLFIKTNADFSTNLPDFGNILWNIDYKEYTGIGKYTSREMIKEGASITISNPNTNASAQRYDMEVVSQTAKGYKFKASTNAYNTALNPNYGSLRYIVDKPYSYGEIDLLSSKTQTLKVYQTGIIQLRYTDACGISSDLIDINMWATGFTTVSGYKNYYKCLSNAPLGTISTPINIVCNGTSKMYHINIEVLQEKSVNTLNAEAVDSISASLLKL